VIRFGFLAAAACLAIAGCSKAAPELDMIQAVKRTQSARSARFEIRGVGAVGSERTSIACDGLADYVRRRSRISCRLGELGLDSVSIGGVSYTRLHGKGLSRLSDDGWQRGSDGSGNTLQDLTPTKLLAMPRSATLRTEHVGSEDVRGADTEHYRLTVDRKKAQLQSSDGKTARVDVWVDSDGLLRRVEAEDHGRFTLEFFDFGTSVDIEPPPASQVEKPERTIARAPLPPCGGAHASPITFQQALAALRRAGFSVDTKAQSCGMAPVAMLISNLSATTTSEAAMAREGRLTCVLLRRAPGSTRLVLVPSGSEAHLQLANLSCSLYVVGNDPDPVPKIARLRQAFAELRRLVRP
jgi:hypothetical protein